MTAHRRAKPALDHLSLLMEQFVDLDRVLALASLEDEHQTAALPSRAAGDAARIAVARDRAFCFYYEDNLDALRAAGAEIVEFSPVADRMLPVGTDALYLGYGYPELHAAELSANHSMRGAIARFVESGGPTYVLASYIHLHFLSNPQLSVNFVGAARRSRARVQTS